ncbi:hypothetical protein PMAYCL1PPCAC_22682 [Pristionchus mayeri]|uniref:Uncharacterized protein n=1 Tax=Pristionchus mayeri TaxID=1317129 RepID=A0AAN5CXR4_9BILA|nr:hypothetical protein PMAYCL1PPCAC_22682 [Pristionchus mayeri]
MNREPDPNDPNDRMNPNVPVQLFLNDPPKRKQEAPKRKRVREPIEIVEPIHEFELITRLSPVKQTRKEDKIDEKKPLKRKDPRFTREPEIVFCNKQLRRWLASSLSDLQTHFLRTIANIVVHRFSNYGIGNPDAYVDKIFQGKVPYKFCTIPAVREYIDASMYGIRDELKPQKIEAICFAITNELEESLLEVEIDLFQTEKFHDRRIRGQNPTGIRELREKLCTALIHLQRLQLTPAIYKQLSRARTGLTIRYATIDCDPDDDDLNCPDGWEPIFPTPADWCGWLHTWTDPITTEFNHMKFHVLTDPLVR